MFGADVEAPAAPAAPAPLCVSELSLSESCSSVGIASLTLQTLEHVSLCQRMGLQPVVAWWQCVHCGPASGANHAAAFFDLKQGHVLASGTGTAWAAAQGGGGGFICLGDPTCFGIPFAEVGFGSTKDALRVPLDAELRQKGQAAPPQARRPPHTRQPHRQPTAPRRPPCSLPQIRTDAAAQSKPRPRAAQCAWPRHGGGACFAAAAQGPTCALW